MTATLLGTDVADVLDAVLADGPETLYVVNPSGRVLERLTNAAVASGDDLPPIRVLGESEMLKAVLDDFLVASTAADLIEADVLSLRTLSESVYCSTIVTDVATVAVVEAEDVVGGLATKDADFVDVTFESATAEWNRSSSYSLRTPAISRVYETLEREIGPDVREDFEAMLGALETARGDGTDLDEVTISLLVAAANGVLLYDISKWGEDVGIASKATFSRTKTKLEDVGLVDTEKVPIDVGRPRLRLRLAGDLADADPEAVVATAVETLSS
ncbi:MAG: transcriptional regulator TbsP [Halanaeroarchaeum sp.]